MPGVSPSPHPHPHPQSVSLFDAGHRAVLDAGKPLVYVCPPAPWATAPLFSYLVHDTARPTNAARPIRNLIVTGTVGAAEDFRSALRPVGTYVHPVTGLARVERLLRTGGANGEAVADLAVRAADAQELVRRAVLKLDRVERIVLAWPEALLEAGAGEDLDLLLSEAAAGEAQRIILTSDSELLSGFLERHARRAPTATYAEPPPPQRRAPMIRSVITDPLHRRATCIDVLDVTNRQRVLVWDPATAGGLSDLDRYPDVTVIESADPVADLAASGSFDLAIATDLPSGSVLAQLLALASEVVVLARASQVPYLSRLADVVKPLPLPSEVDRARDRAFALRARLRESLAGRDWTTELLALEPLLYEFDAAAIAAAAMALSSGPPAPTAATWTHIRISAGRTDGIRAGDIVGVLLNSVGLRKEDIGRIDLRDRFTLAEVRPEHAERAVRGLNGASLRGKRVTARLDTK